LRKRVSKHIEQGKEKHDRKRMGEAREKTMEDAERKERSERG